MRAEVQALAPESPISVAASLSARMVRYDQLNQQYRVLRQRGVVDTLAQVEISSVPFPDDQSIVYPDKEFWQEMTLRRKKFAAVDLKKQSPAEVKIRKALDEPTNLEFVETPLTDVIDYLKDLHGIEIQIDNKALEDAATGTDTPVTRNLRGISLRSALRLMLGPLDLAYVIKDEVLLITTKEKADAELVTKVYPVADLVLSPFARTPRMMSGMNGMGGMGGGMGSMMVVVGWVAAWVVAMGAAAWVAVWVVAWGAAWAAWAAAWGAWAVAAAACSACPTRPSPPATGSAPSRPAKGSLKLGPGKSALTRSSRPDRQNSPVAGKSGSAQQAESRPASPPALKAKARESRRLRPSNRLRARQRPRAKGPAAQCRRDSFDDPRREPTIRISSGTTISRLMRTSIRPSCGKRPGS